MFESHYSNSDIAIVENKINDALAKSKGVSWQDRGAIMASLVFSEKEFLILVDSMSGDTLNIDDYSWRWYRTDIVSNIMPRFPEHLEKVLMSCNDPYFARSLMRSGSIELSQIKFMAKSKSKDVRKVVAEICSVDSLRGMVDDPSLSVRKTVLSRLGPVDFLDRMLKDKSADIRYMGLEFAPRNYKKLSEMTGEISGKVFRLLIDKIRREDLPLLLSNRNLKDRHISAVFDSRMQSGK